MKDTSLQKNESRGWTLSPPFRQFATLVAFLFCIVGVQAAKTTFNPNTVNSGSQNWRSGSAKSNNVTYYYKGAGTYFYGGDFNFYLKINNAKLTPEKPYVEFEFIAQDNDDGNKDMTYANGVFIKYKNKSSYELVAHMFQATSTMTHTNTSTLGVVTKIKMWKDGNDAENHVLRYYPRYIDEIDNEIEYVRLVSYVDYGNGGGDGRPSYGVTDRDIDYMFVYDIPVSYDFSSLNDKTAFTEKKGGVTEVKVSDLPCLGIGTEMNHDWKPGVHKDNVNANVNWNPDATVYGVENSADEVICTEELSHSVNSSTGKASASGNLINVENHDSRRYYVDYRLARSFKVGTNGYLANIPHNVFQELRYREYESYLNPINHPQGRVSAISNMWEKSITITWNPRSGNSINDGKWYIFRRAEQSNPADRELLGSVAYGTTSYTDKNVPEYDKDYVYEVSFGLNSWGSLTTIEPYLTKQCVSGVYRTFPIALNIEALEESGVSAGLKLTWNHQPVKETGVEFFVYRRERPTDENGVPVPDNDPVLATIPFTQIATVNRLNSTVNSHTYTDREPSNVCALYEYKITTTALDMDFESNSVYSTIAGGSRVRSLKCSKGSYASSVKVQWEALQVGDVPTKYVIMRRQLGSDMGFSKVYTTQGTANEYNFDDNTVFPGNYYEYKVEAYAKCNDTTYKQSNSITDEGFSQSTGIISGRVTYGTGSAVQGVKVVLTQSETDMAKNQFYALNVSSTNSGLRYDFNEESNVNPFAAGKPFNIQLWTRINSNITLDGGAVSKPAILATEAFLLYGEYNAETNSYAIKLRLDNGNNTEVLATATTLQLEADRYHYLSLSYDGTNNWTISTVNDLGDSLIVSQGTSARTSYNEVKTLRVGSALRDADFSAYVFNGFVDEIRVWSKELSANEVLGNYNRLIAGNESKLAIYWPIDEGIANQATAYDYSKTNGVPNEHHGQILMGSDISTVVPTQEQFSLYGLTDAEGNYVVRGIPFFGDGVNYVATPVMGIHKFSPAYVTRFVSANSLTHSAVDITDVSSFPVKGTVYYSGTNIPVEGATLYVDGNACSRDGEIIKTDENGEYEISVPIGDHYVQVKMDGHTFESDGRYPADPAALGLTLPFVNSVSNLTFYDNTLVTVAGRVVGGEIEEVKPLGFGLSKNNIGKAEIVLKLNENTKFNVDVVNGVFENGTTERVYDNVNSDVNSTAVTGIGSLDALGKITITTDSLTGEFAVKLPPLNYTVASITVASNNSIDFSGTLGNLNASDPVVVMKDSIPTDDGYEYFPYVAALVKAYRVPQPSFEVTQDGLPLGAYGIDSYEFVDGDYKDTLQIMNIAEDGTVAYNYTYPVFIQGEQYKFGLYGYERYENRDNSDNVIVDDVSLRDVVVTVTNQLSADQKVVIDEGENEGKILELAANEILLDSAGRASYTFTAGFPNIIEEQGFARGMNYTFDVNAQMCNWEHNSDFRGIILGVLPSGTNFVSAGPDELLMVLRDPPGTASSATWEEGTSVTTRTSRSAGTQVDTDTQIKLHLGYSFETVSGVGFAVTNTISMVNDLTTGVKAVQNTVSSNEVVNTLTAIRNISTSSDPNFVGHEGDLFIGHATNILFGNARQVGFYRNQEGNVVLGRADVMTTGSQFGTMFSYTETYIKHTLIPNLNALKRSMIRSVSEAEYNRLSSQPNTTQSPIYISKLSESDPRFGSSNNDKEIWGSAANSGQNYYAAEGPSYKCIVPNDGKRYQDSVMWYNTQIAVWEGHMEANERAKVTAIENSTDYLKENLSFDAGAVVSGTVTTTTSKAWSTVSTSDVAILVADEFGATVNDLGASVSLSVETTVHEESGTESGSETTTSISYTLAEEGEDDALTVDIFNAPDKFGPIFVTRGGQTSCPYEGEEVTQYYNPGTSISTATMQIEIPEITVINNTATNVPDGRPANFTVELTNLSETNEDVWFNIAVLDESNPNGARIWMDGQTLTGNRPILVRAGEVLSKSLQLYQTDGGVLDYENILIVLKSQCQGDPTDNMGVVADTVAISAYFIPSCSDISVEVGNTTVNTNTGTTLTVRVNDVDRNYRSFSGFRLQYKYAGNPDWTLIQEFVADESEAVRDKLYMGDAAPVIYAWDMKDLADGDYLLRGVTVCDFGTGEVNNYSEEIAIVKDVAQPMIMGTPSPADGILGVGTDVYVTFNEDIRNGLITKTDNVLVYGTLNGEAVDHTTALKLPGGNDFAARSEANILLGGDGFSVDMWLNLTTGGVLWHHGSDGGNFSVGVDAQNKLTLDINGNSYTSVNAMPMNEWAYLTFSYDRTVSPKFSATVYYGSSSTDLFVGEGVVDYSLNGRIGIGKGAVGSMHELTLWNSPRDKAESASEMYTTKSAVTPGLVGYWKMDEGHGSRITDVARQRHLVSDNLNWHIADANKAAAFNGTSSYASLDISDISARSTDDYAVEFWFRGGAQSAAATLFAVGDETLALQAATDGTLNLIVDGAVVSLSATDYMDNTWHHFALNVLRNGNTTAYVDGTAIKQLSSKMVPALGGAAMTLGARTLTTEGVLAKEYRDFFAGEIDEFRYWRATLTGSVFDENRNRRLDARTSAGLMAYYPFEENVMDQFNQYVTNFTGNDKAYNAENGNPSVKVAQFNEVDEASAAPGLKGISNRRLLDYSFVASERQIFITLHDEPYRLEGTTVEFMLKEVRDINNNEMSAVLWTAYVNRNTLRLSEQEFDIVQQEGENEEFVVTVSNSSPNREQWVLSNIPSWLNVSKASGALSALESANITFEVRNSTPIGKYEETVYISGNDGIYVPLVVRLNVTGERPEWSVNPSDYEYSMNMVGQMQVDNVVTDDPEDILAAFVNGVCVGVASPVYYVRYDSYYIHLTLYGNDGDLGDEVSFKMWDASTGDVYSPVSVSEEVVFVSNKVTGSMGNPFIWNAREQREQRMDMAQGWSWISLYVVPETNESTLNDLFSENVDSFELIKSENEFSVPDNNSWTGTVTDVNVGKLYKVRTNSDVRMSIYGNTLVASDYPVAIVPNWNWIGFNSNARMSVDDAFADLEPESGDVLKGQTGFSVYEDYQWIGTLGALVPGEGYMYQSKATEDKSFVYPAVRANVSRVSSPYMVQEESLEPEVFTPVGVNAYPGNMTMIAKVRKDDRFIGNVEVGAFVGDECRGAIKAMDNGLVFLTIFGEMPNEKIVLKVVVDGEVIVVNQEVLYKEDDMYGSIDEPYIINTDTHTGLETIFAEDGEFEVYSLNGIYLGDSLDNLVDGLYIINNTKVLVRNGKVVGYEK